MPTEDTVGVNAGADNAAPAPEVETSATQEAPDAGAGVTAGADDGLNDDGSFDNSSTEQQTDPVDPAKPTPDEGGPEIPEGQDSAPTKEDPRYAALNNRYSHLRRSVDERVGKVTNRNRELETQLERFKRENAQREEQERAAKLEPWSKKHPENAKFKSLKDRAKTIRETLRNLNFPEGTTEEMKTATKQSILGNLKPEEWDQLGGYEAKLRERSEELLEDPESFITPMVERLVQAGLQKAQQDFQVDHEVEQDFNDPTLKPLLEQYPEEFSKALNDGVPYHYAVHQMKLFHKMSQLENDLAKYTKKSTHVEAQQRLAKTSASITRDPRPQKTNDVYGMARKWAKENDVEIGGVRFNQKLLDLEKKFSGK